MAKITVKLETVTFLLAGEAKLRGKPELHLPAVRETGGEYSDVEGIL